MRGKARLRTALIILVTATIAVAGVITGSAGAAVSVTCVYNGASKVLTVTNHALAGIPVLSVSGGAIVVLDQTTPVSCSGGSPTTTNTDTIVLNDDVGVNTDARIHDPQAFAPGATQEGSPSFPLPSEIEFQANLGNGQDRLLLYARNTSVNWHLGDAGVNFVNYASGSIFNDVDLTVSGVDQTEPVGGSGADTITGAGGAGTGNPYPYEMSHFGGGQGDDLQVGGAANDVIAGSGSGADDIRGGGGSDTVDYSNVPAPGVHVSLDGVANDGHASDESATSPGTFDNVRSSVENIIGTPYDDVLVGDGGPNWIVGKPGADKLLGAPGDDLLVAKDGVADLQINCGAGTDTETHDAIDPAPVGC